MNANQLHNSYIVYRFYFGGYVHSQYRTYYKVMFIPDGDWIFRIKIFKNGEEILRGDYTGEPEIKHAKMIVMLAEGGQKEFPQLFKRSDENQ